MFVLIYVDYVVVFGDFFIFLVMVKINCYYINDIYFIFQV